VLGYDKLGLDDNLPQAGGLIDATLIQGDYVAVHNYGWTEFEIDPLSQQLHVTAWGVEPYSAEDLAADPGSVISQVPRVVSEFTVNPHMGSPDETGNEPSSEVTNLLGDLIEWKETIENFGEQSLSELARRVGGDDVFAPILQDLTAHDPLQGFSSPILNGGEFLIG
jgi:hypothetical protein